MKNRINGSVLWLIAAMLLVAPSLQAQVTLSGSIQSDILIPQDDEKIGTEHYSDWALTNTYVDLKLGSKYVEAAARL